MEQPFTGDELVEDDAQREDVGARIDRMPRALATVKLPIVLAAVRKP